MKERNIVIDRVKSFTERQTKRRLETSGLSASIRNFLGLRKTPPLDTLQSYKDFSQSPETKLSTLLEQFYKKSGRHFSVLDAQSILRHSMQQLQESQQIKLLHKKLQQRRQGKRYLVDQIQIDPVWAKPDMKTFVRNILTIQKPYNQWIGTYIRIGQAINMYMKTNDITKTNTVIRSYASEDPVLIGDLSTRFFTPEDMKKIIDQLKNLFRETKGLPEPVLLFRAIKVRYRDASSSDPAMMTIPHFISTSRGRLKIMDYFVDALLPNPEYPEDRWQRKRGTVFRILVPAGTKIIYLRGDEKEIILPPGKFRVVHNTPAEKKRYAEQGDIDVVDVIYHSDDSLYSTQ